MEEACAVCLRNGSRSNKWEGGGKVREPEKGQGLRGGGAGGGGEGGGGEEERGRGWGGGRGGGQQLP